MDIFTIVFWVIAIIFFVISLVKYKKETVESMKKSKGMMGRMLSDVIAIIFLIGLILAFIPPEVIEKTLGSNNVSVAVIIALLIFLFNFLLFIHRNSINRTFIKNLASALA